MICYLCERPATTIAEPGGFNACAECAKAWALTSTEKRADVESDAFLLAASRYMANDRKYEPWEWEDAANDQADALQRNEAWRNNALHPRLFDAD